MAAHYKVSRPRFKYSVTLISEETFFTYNYKTEKCSLRENEGEFLWGKYWRDFASENSKSINEILRLFPVRCFRKKNTETKFIWRDI